MTGMIGGSLQPTYMGHVSTARDALRLFEACLRGHLHHVPRRPHDRERSQLIKSGCIFIYEENASGIKRWTDGVPWSPSRILGNFLVYRELVKPFPPGEKKRAQKRAKINRTARSSDPYPNQRRESEDVIPTIKAESNAEGREGERALIGSLVDSYGFKEGGLVKKTMSVNVNGIHHHLVSYYNIDDVLAGNLQSPSKDKSLDEIEPRVDLVARQNFRAPIDDLDISVQDHLGNLSSAYGVGSGSGSGNGNGGGYGYEPYRGPIPMMGGHIPQNPPAHPHMSMPIYNPPTYTTTASAVPPTYAAVSQSYYPTTTPLPQVTYPQPFISGPSSLSMSTDAHSNPQHPQHHLHHQHTYPYHRQSYPPANMSTRVGSIDSITPSSDGKASESSDWHRHGHAGGSYSSLTSPISAQSAYGSAQHWTAPPLPTREEAWPNYKTGPPKHTLHLPPHSG